MSSEDGTASVAAAPSAALVATGDVVAHVRAVCALFWPAVGAAQVDAALLKNDAALVTAFVTDPKQLSLVTFFFLFFFFFSFICLMLLPDFAIRCPNRVRGSQRRAGGRRTRCDRFVRETELEPTDDADVVNSIDNNINNNDNNDAVLV